MNTEMELQEEFNSEATNLTNQVTPNLSDSANTNMVSSRSWSHGDKVNTASPWLDKSPDMLVAELEGDEDDSFNKDEDQLDDNEKFGDDNKTDLEGNSDDDIDDEDLDGSIGDDAMEDPEDFDEEADDEDY